MGEVEQQQQETPQGVARGVINTIVGGFAGVGCINTTMKCHLRDLKNVNLIHTEQSPCYSMPAITLIDVDFVGNDSTQDDPMMVTIVILGWAICKTRIDQGSSTNILY